MRRGCNNQIGDLFAPAVQDGLYEEVFCLKDMSILHVDWGNFETKEVKNIKAISANTLTNGHHRMDS